MSAKHQEPKRVCVVGAESSGTTTLARELAEHYHTVWVPEFGRKFTEDMVARLGSMSAIRWKSEDFLLIARQQVANENEAARRAHGVLFCDTDALATCIWHERYLGTWPKDVDAIASAQHYDLYLLTDCDIPFVQDGVRDGEHLRQWMTRRFREELERRGHPWLLIHGPHQTRLQTAIHAVDSLLAEKLVLPQT